MTLTQIIKKNIELKLNKTLRIIIPPKYLQHPIQHKIYTSSRHQRVVGKMIVKNLTR